MNSKIAVLIAYIVIEISMIVNFVFAMSDKPSVTNTLFAMVFFAIAALFTKLIANQIMQVTRQPLPDSDGYGN